MNRYYVYEHLKATDGSVFYVGKGCGRRAWSHNRTAHWKRVVAKHGLTVRIVKENLPESCALTIERMVIAKHGIENLVNICEFGNSHGYYLAKPVYSSEGELFKSMQLAAEAMQRQGYEKATSSKIGLCAASGGVRQSYGRLWSTKAFPDPPSVKGRDAVIESWRKKVYSSLGERFDSVADAVRWLKANGYPNAQAMNICSRARIVSGTIYGRCWSYDGIPDHPELIGRAASMAASSDLRSITLYCSNGMMFKNAKAAKLWLETQGVSCKSPSKMSQCAMGKSKTAYGFRWSHKEFSDAETV